VEKTNLIKTGCHHIGDLNLINYNIKIYINYKVSDMLHLLIGDPIIYVALILFLYYTCVILIKLANNTKVDFFVILKDFSKL
jgi:hypothetical protein